MSVDRRHEKSTMQSPAQKHRLYEDMVWSIFIGVTIFFIFFFPPAEAIYNKLMLSAESNKNLAGGWTIIHQEKWAALL